MNLKNNLFLYFVFLALLIMPNNLTFAALPASSHIPTVVSQKVTVLNYYSVRLTGSVNPNGMQTNAWYETLSGKVGNIQAIGSGDLPFTLNSYTLTDLSPNTSYKFRIGAKNYAGVVYGDWVTFDMPSNIINNNGNGNGNNNWINPVYKVSVNTQYATLIKENSAILNGTINPNGHLASAWFEYGTSPNPFNYNQTGRVSFGPSLYFSPISQGISNLTPNTTYYFRLVGSNYAGKTTGIIYSFTTQKINNETINNEKIISTENPPKEKTDTPEEKPPTLENPFKINNSTIFTGLGILILIIIVAFLFAKRKSKY